jgi:hypothetical protein
MHSTASCFREAATRSRWRTCCAPKATSAPPHPHQRCAGADAELALQQSGGVGDGLVGDAELARDLGQALAFTAAVEDGFFPLAQIGRFRLQLGHGQSLGDALAEIDFALQHLRR